jgi:hypothetical protein
MKWWRPWTSQGAQTARYRVLTEVYRRGRASQPACLPAGQAVRACLELRGAHTSCWLRMSPLGMQGKWNSFVCCVAVEGPWPLYVRFTNSNGANGECFVYVHEFLCIYRPLFVKLSGFVSLLHVNLEAATVALCAQRLGVSEVLHSQMCGLVGQSTAWSYSILFCVFALIPLSTWTV